MHIVKAMETVPEVAEIAARAEAANIGMDAVLRRAGIARTTWWRWVDGRFEPRMSTLRRVHQALEAELQERAAA